jgi:tRNA(fMet)-specific endonuclease VapC
VYCFDTDVLSAVLKPRPELGLVRKLARTPAEHQFTTAINLAELIHGAARKGNVFLEKRIRDLVGQGVAILPFDQEAAERYGWLRARLESEGRRLADPDLQIASVALSRGLAVVTANVRHFGRIPDLQVENWLST